MAVPEAEAAEQASVFQHQPQDGDCSCPIHRNRSRRPFTAPLGMRFADSVSVEPIPQAWAKDIYNAHHGYMGGDDLHNANFDHHGLYYRGQLMGAITWRYPPFSRKKVAFNESGELIQTPYTDAELETELPDELVGLGKVLLGDTDEDDVDRREVLQGDQFAEANRICLGERMPNLASCSLAASQEYFVESSECPASVDYLITYVRADFRGSMLRALYDKGWECIGFSKPKQASNREYKEIRDRYKWVFVCPVERIEKQAALSSWAEAGSQREAAIGN